MVPSHRGPGTILDIRFASSDDTQIAYHVVGDGPVDLVYVQGFLSHLEVHWELPELRSWCERLGEFARVILFDKRGMGMSDRVPGTTPLDDRMDDIRAVMDAAGSERAFLMGASEGGPLSILFAAAHPDRTLGLILIGAEVKERKDDDWPWGEMTEEKFEQAMTGLAETWGRSMTVGRIAPSAASDDRVTAWVNRLAVNAATPAAAEAFMRMAFDIDVRPIAKAIRVPTLVLHAAGDRVCHVENGRWLAQEIPNARYVEMPGSDHIPIFEPEAYLAEIREFVTGTREPETPDRVLATVLFTDIVGSTQRAAELGDHRWRPILEGHHAMLRSELSRFRGTEVGTAGDSFLAMFDGPARAIRCARSIVDAGKKIGIGIRAGIHTGEVERLGDDIAGITVHIGARIGAMAGAGEVLVSGTVRDLVAGSGISFTDRGMHELRGVPGEWRVLAVSPTTT